MDVDALFAWANLVGALIDLLREGGFADVLIHAFLDRLDRANDAVLNGEARIAYMKVTSDHRLRMVSNG